MDETNQKKSMPTDKTTKNDVKPSQNLPTVTPVINKESKPGSGTGNTPEMSTPPGHSDTNNTGNDWDNIPLSEDKVLLIEGDVILDEPIIQLEMEPIQMLRLEWKELYEHICNAKCVQLPESKNPNQITLWQLIQKFLSFLNHLRSNTQQLALTQPESQRHIEILSLQEEGSLETLIHFLIGYITRCLSIYPTEFGLNANTIDSKLTKSQLEIFQKFTTNDPTTSTQTPMMKLTIVFGTILDCSLATSETDIDNETVEPFRKILVQIQPNLLLPICLQYFYDPCNNNKFNLFKSQILFNLPLLPTLKFLLNASSNTQGSSKFSWIKIFSKHWLLELIENKPNVLVELIQTELPGVIPLIDSARLVSTLLKLSLKSSNSSFEQIETKVTNYSQQILNILFQDEGSFQIQICLIAGLTLGTFSPRLTNELFFAKLFGPIQQLITGATESLDPATLPKICMYAKHLLNCPNIVVADIQSKFSTFWNTLFGIWGSIKSITSTGVIDMDVEFQMELIIQSLEPVILQLIDKIPTANLLNQLLTMILNCNEKKETLNPLFYHLVTDDEDSSVLMVIQTPPTTLSKSQIFHSLQKYCKVLMKLLDKSKLQILFQQLLSYESKIKLSAEDTMKINEIEHLCAMEVRPDSGKGGQRATVHLLNRNDILIYQKFITSSLLSEYENYENILEQFVTVKENTVINPDYEILHETDNPESGEPPLSSSSLFLGLIMDKLESEYDSFCLSSSTKAVQSQESFEFTKSIVYCLDLIGVFCSTVKDSEKSTTPATWEELTHFLPFLQKFQSTKIRELVAIGIPDKCEYLATFIQTHGRGVDDQKSKISVVEKSKFKETMFNISTSLPHMRGAGFIQLKKLIHAQDPEVPQNFDLILRLSFQELRDPDTYVYTHCINALVALGRVYHQEFLPKFIEAYVQEESTVRSAEDDNTKHFSTIYVGIKSEEETLKLRMKIGEILIKILKDFPSPILEKYAVPLANVTFRLSHESKDPMIRASAIQNLAELLCYLGRPMGEFLIWVGNSTRSCILIEKEPQVLRSLFALIEKVFEGISRIVNPAESTDESLGTFIRDFYRLIKQEANNPAHFGDKAIMTRLENCLKLTQSIGEILMSCPTNVRPVSLFPHL